MSKQLGLSPPASFAASSHSARLGLLALISICNFQWGYEAYCEVSIVLCLPHIAVNEPTNAPKHVTKERCFLQARHHSVDLLVLRMMSPQTASLPAQKITVGPSVKEEQIKPVQDIKPSRNWMTRQPSSMKLTRSMARRRSTRWFSTRLFSCRQGLLYLFACLPRQAF